MASKRVLLIQEDRLLSSYYRDYLENGGFQVEIATSGEEALEMIKGRLPDVLLIDPIIPGMEAASVVAAIRHDPVTKGMPVIALPTARGPLADAVQHAGATQVLFHSLNPPAELTDAIQQSLGWERSAFVKKMSPFKPDPSWITMSFETAPEILGALRHSLQNAMRDGGEPGCQGALLQRIHGFTEQMALFGQRPLFLFASAMEALAFELFRFPEHANPSTLRTLGQAIDFLGLLLSEAHRPKLKDPSDAQILVVDDEEGARKIVMAAMSLVDLSSSAADTPSAGLAASSTQPFDLIFLDVGLPEMTGFELCARVRATSLNERTPIVFITGMATFQNRVQSSLSGGSDFVGKPFSVPELGLKALIWVFKGQLALL